MLIKLIKKINRNQKGITGLETAIILIAFVVVASVFAYTVLSAGIFSSQKGKEAIYSGLSEARATIEPKGSMVAYGADLVAEEVGDPVVYETVGKVSFTVTNALAGQAIDLTPSYILNAGALEAQAADVKHVTLISYIDDNQMVTDTAWTLEFIGKNNGDNLLESGEQAVITVWLLDFDGTDYSLGTDETDPFIDDADNELGIYDTFTVEVKGAQGAALTMERTLPARLDLVMDLR